MSAICRYAGLNNKLIINLIKIKKYSYIEYVNSTHIVYPRGSRQYIKIDTINKFIEIHYGIVTSRKVDFKEIINTINEGF